MLQNQHRIAPQPGQSWLKGALAGFVATVPMTVFMLATQRFLPKGQQYALPPEIIIKELAHRTRKKRYTSKNQILGTTMLSHFGYGATMGALYTPMGKKIPLPTPLKGAIFGLGVWSASYLALIPVIGISVSGQREPRHRNLLMLAAHVVWGSAMGVIIDVLK